MPASTPMTAAQADQVIALLEALTERLSKILGG
jgi:hypothetical protein